MNLIDWSYIIPAIICVGLVAIYCYFFDKQVFYFRVSVDNPLDIDYSDYVENYPFFDKVNKRLEAYLMLYAREHFYRMGLPYQCVRVTTSTCCEKIDIACYLEVSRKQQKLVKNITLSSVNLEEEVQDFYRFIDIVKDPQYEYITKIKGLEQQKYVLAN